MINVNIDNATLEGYKAATKHDDLNVYSVFTIKCMEEGSPELLTYFDDKDSPFLSKIGELARNDTSKVYKIPLDEPMKVSFGEASFEACLTEICLQRNFKKQINSYSFTFEKISDGDDVTKIVIPYLKARELVEAPPPKNPNQKPRPDKYELIKFNANFTNEGTH